MYVNYEPVRNTYVNLQYVHTGKRDRFAPDGNGHYSEGEGIIKRIDMVNMTAGYKWCNWDFCLGISNLLNNTYYTPASMMMARDAEYAHGNGRNVTLTVSYRY